MAENTQADTTLRRYLLGQLSDEQRMEVERRYLADSDLLDELSAVEDDLFDEYVNDYLDPLERKLLEQNLLTTPDQVNKLRTAQVLVHSQRERARKPMRPEQSSGPWLSSWLNIFRTHPLRALAAAAAVVLVLIIGLWLFLRQQQQGANQLATTNPEFSTPANINNQSPVPRPSPVASVNIIVTLNDGAGKVAIDEEGNVSGLGDLAGPVAKSIRDALINRRLSVTSALEGLSHKDGTLMGSEGDGQSFAVIGPAGIVCREDRPTFSWRALSGAHSYVVKIYDTNFKEVLSSSPQTALTWTAGSPLPRGAIYVWQVTATKGAEEIKSPVPPAPEARFRVLSEDKASQIDQAERTQPNSHLLLGVLYADAGLLKDAQREFRLLVKANPESEVAKSLLRQVSK